VVVFATYASLVDREDIDAPWASGRFAGPWGVALAGGERLYGQQMAPFDLAIVDEAHGIAGDLGRPWAAIHDNSRIPADFRLYLTATPRILASPRPQKGADGQELEIATRVERLAIDLPEEGVLVAGELVCGSDVVEVPGLVLLLPGDPEALEDQEGLVGGDQVCLIDGDLGSPVVEPEVVLGGEQVLDVGRLGGPSSWPMTVMWVASTLAA
jgi:hypothetical protein